MLQNQTAIPTPAKKRILNEKICEAAQQLVPQRLTAIFRRIACITVDTYGGVVFTAVGGMTRSL